MSLLKQNQIIKRSIVVFCAFLMFLGQQCFCVKPDRPTTSPTTSSDNQNLSRKRKRSSSPSPIPIPRPRARAIPSLTPAEDALPLPLGWRSQAQSPARNIRTVAEAIADFPLIRDNKYIITIIEKDGYELLKVYFENYADQCIDCISSVEPTRENGRALAKNIFNSLKYLFRFCCHLNTDKGPYMADSSSTYTNPAILPAVKAYATLKRVYLNFIYYSTGRNLKVSNEPEWLINVEESLSDEPLPFV